MNKSKIRETFYKGGLLLYVYAEYILLENIIINYIILYATKKFTRTETSIIRLIIAAIIGALYTFVLFFPSLKFMTKFSIKFSISVLIIILAFNPEKIDKFLKLIATFYCISFVFAGASLALFYLLDFNVYYYNGVFYIKDFPASILIIGIFLSFLILKYIINHISKKVKKEEMLITLTIILNGKEASLIGLIDTGNSLTEPITHNPVVIAEFNAIKEILPVDIRSFYESEYKRDILDISNFIANSSEKIPLRLIPFKSIGKDNGMLLGFKPDELIIDSSGYDNNKNLEVIVAIYNDKLSQRDEKYKALLNPEILC